MQSGFWLENLNENVCIEDLGVDGLDRLAENVLVCVMDSVFVVIDFCLHMCV